mmetsp:Transcript_13206/g.28652  ORF Transcript_13206/g.28652 Transcript_13206/m.28652 type:complete len:160 (+) Transcript_13206:626-1105(+)
MAQNAMVICGRYGLWLMAHLNERASLHGCWVLQSNTTPNNDNCCKWVLKGSWYVREIEKECHDIIVGGVNLILIPRHIIQSRDFNFNDTIAIRWHLNDTNIILICNNAPNSDNTIITKSWNTLAHSHHVTFTASNQSILVHCILHINVNINTLRCSCRQ